MIECQTDIPYSLNAKLNTMFSGISKNYNTEVFKDDMQ